MTDTEQTFEEWLLGRAKEMEGNADHIESQARDHKLRADWYRRRAKEIRDAVDVLRAPRQ